MLRKVLIANRGEVAVRIIRACKELGMRTVAVFSEPDRPSIHVRYADEAYCIGPGPVKASYLNADAILDVAHRSRADAIHPGYGFLAENPSFADRCWKEGIIFVGPSPQTLALAGDKIAARRLMERAGLPVISGTFYELPDEQLAHAAAAIGYPVLLKAAAGGGGKGIRVVNDPCELANALSLVRAEAESAFGDGRVYLEPLLPRVRHIEFQILADQQGHMVHLGEREGSIQRRHQKVLEEAPSIALSDSLRAEMGAAALEAARAVGYVNAGTIEFLLDEEGHFYFLEINPRLQVEHGVTEMITGIDIVKEQLRIASGRKLRYKQSDIILRGWSLECRILAEDPYNDFRPSVGRITGLREPAGPGVRVDSGIFEGCEITHYYDSLLGKLITWGQTRAEAILRMRRALSEYRIMGIHTNIIYHQQIMDSIAFQGGQTDTEFVDRHAPAEELLMASDASDPKTAAIVAALLAEQERTKDHTSRPASASTESAWKIAARREMFRRWPY